MAPDKPKKWAIEDSFPIAEINRLAVPERNAFKPIYRMHKWFARRASCVFRAILLGCLKPLPLGEDGNPVKSGAEVIMEDFYKDHTHDPDTNGKVVLDPFMGGGTTVVEALRLGCKVVGIDLNPVAWFIVKCETTPVNPEELKRAFKDLAGRTVPWSGKPLKETLLDLYKTECPCCGNAGADIIYAFWVKSAVCTDPTCGKQVPLFSDYVVAAKQPSIRYVRDASCPECAKEFDWELDPATLVAERTPTVVNAADGAGVGRGNRRWAFSPSEPVGCPWCGRSVKPNVSPAKAKPARKEVPLTVLLCPSCQAVWQCRGTVPPLAACPACKHEYEPAKGNATGGGGYVCPHCGKKDKVLASVRSLPEGRTLPMAMYAIQGWCPACGGGEKAGNGDFDENLGAAGGRRKPAPKESAHHSSRWCLIAKQGGKFFKRVEPADIERYDRAVRTWEAQKERLPYPKSKVPKGQETHRLLEHNFRYWHQMFNSRERLALSSLLLAIGQELSIEIRHLLLTAFFNLLNNTGVFATYRTKVLALRQVFARHDYAPKTLPCEHNVWGSAYGMGGFSVFADAVLNGVCFAVKPSDRRVVGIDGRGKTKQKECPNGETVFHEGAVLALEATDSRTLNDIAPAKGINSIVTDPPYASNVNYSELSDYFYVWLRLVLKDEFSHFMPEYTPKSPEIIVNPTRKVTAADFEAGLRDVFHVAGEKLAPSGLLAFTFHHAEGTAWEALLEAVCEAGYSVEAIYPIQGEPEASLHLLDKQAISYDLIHVCRKRKNAAVQPRSWAGIRQEIRRRARQEIAVIERGRYGNEPLSPADVNIVLIGKCLELYSRHYGRVLDHRGENVPLHEALEAIRMEVDQLVSAEQPLPSELADIDPPSYVYLACLADKAFEIKSDELHKYTRGVIEPDELMAAGLVIKGRAGRGRYYKIKSPAERFAELQKRFAPQAENRQATLAGMEEIAAAAPKGRAPFIDHVHFLLALAEGGENLRPWTERFRGLTPQIRAACEYLRERQPRFAPACDKILKFIEVTPLFAKG